MKKALIAIALTTGLALLLWLWLTEGKSQIAESEAAPATFVGSSSCLACHPRQHDDWMGSHHERSMLQPSVENVRGAFDGGQLKHDGIESRFFQRDGKFFVNTQGPGGENEDYEVAYTFGWYPLQQYLVSFPDGRIQTLRTNWDARPSAEGGQRWFHSYPDEHIPPGDELHWAGRPQNWNFMCAECHNTGFKKNYDPATRSFTSTWEEINVGCEACHGPASKHLAWAKSSEAGRGDHGHRGFASDLVGAETTWAWDVKLKKPVRKGGAVSATEVATCARCHSRRSQLWEEVRHGAMLGQTHRVTTLEEPLYYPDGQIREEVFVYGSFAQSKMHAAGVRCSDCHQAHKTALRFEGNTLCVRCHAKSEYASEQHMHHPAGTPGGNCVDCHMPERTYMVVDPRRDHRFGSPRPDISAKLGTPNACSSCHQEKGLPWVQRAFSDWYGSDLKSQVDHGALFARGRAGDPLATEGLMALAADEERASMTRATALEILAQFPSRESAAVNIRSLLDHDPLVRRQALGGLGALAPASRLQLVIPLLTDEVRSVRMEAARVLMGTPRPLFSAKTLRAFDAALAEYKTAQELNADREFGQYNLGVMYRELGKPELARAAYEEAVFLNPLALRSWVNLADLHREQSREDLVLKTLDRAEEKVGRQGVLYHVRGLSLVRQKKNKAAVIAFQAAADLDPGNPQRCSILVAAQLALGDTVAGIESYRKYLAQRPDDHLMLRAIIDLLVKNNRKTEALPYAQQLLVLFPQEPRFKALIKSLGG